MASTTPEDVKSRLKASYDAIAEKYNAWTVQHLETRESQINKLFSLLSDDKPVSILELGCGSGNPVSQMLLSHPNYSVTANDLSSTQIAIAKASLGSNDRIKFIESDMLSIEAPSASFDAVVAFYSIIHVPREEQLLLFKKIMDWLKPGGYLLANFSEEDMPAFTMQHWLDEKGWMYWSGWGAEETVVKLKDAGLDIVSSETKKDVVDASFLWVLARKP
jgi:ubiquinone/menaquinone biosynthesis C-methylase UbiE